jgi:hypothetical protein
MNWTYTNVRHQFRREAGISLNEYCVLDLIYKTHTSPEHTIDGWANVSYEKMGDFLGLSKGAVHGIIVRIEVNPSNPKMKRTTRAWYSNAYSDDETNAKTAGERVQKIREQLIVQKMNVQKMNENRSENERIRSENERNTKVLNKRKKVNEKAKTDFPSKEERALTFKESLAGYVDEYGQEMIDEFSNYWTESGERNKNLRFECEKFFDRAKRLATWKKRSLPKFGQKAQPTKSEQEILDAVAAYYEKAWRKVGPETLKAVAPKICSIIKSGETIENMAKNFDLSRKLNSNWGEFTFAINNYDKLREISKNYNQ